MQAANKKITQEIITRLVQSVQPQEIYIFGSQAKSNPKHPGKHSDVDLMLVFDDKAGSHDELYHLSQQALWGIGIPIDLVIAHHSQKNKWSKVKFSLYYEATNKGDLIYAA